MDPRGRSAGGCRGMRPDGLRHRRGRRTRRSGRHVRRGDRRAGRPRPRVRSSVRWARRSSAASSTAADAEALLGRVTGVTDLAGLDASDLVIEAATEDVEAKREIFRTLGAVTRPEVILASNTSSIPIVELGIASGRPDRVIGMHFFNPPPVMALLELTPSVTTSDETLAFVRALRDRRARQDVRAGEGPRRVHRQPPARAVPVRRRPALDEGFAIGRGHRHRDPPRSRRIRWARSR